MLFINIPAFAGACSPGIPCTGYDIYTDTTAGTDPALNGPKTGTPAPHTNVTGNTSSACDGNFMNQIYSQAFMEASREVIMGEQMIHKPDSVLEYTCFDQWISVAAHNGAYFSESTEWEDRDVELWTGGFDTTNNGVEPDHGDTTTMNDGSSGGLPFPDQQDYSVFEDDRLDNILAPLLFSSLENYIDANFSHTFLGESTTIDENMNTASIGGSNYNCTHMATVWELAKCIDFGEDDRFRSFQHLVDFDPRTIPLACSPGFESSDAVIQGSAGTKLDNTTPGAGLGVMPSEGLSSPCPAPGGPVAGNNTDFSNDLIRLANNCENAASDPNSFVSFDLMETYTDLINGPGVYVPGVGNSFGIIICGDPVPTGVPVISYDISLNLNSTAPYTGIEATRQAFVHYEHICPNAGCVYIAPKIPYTPLVLPLEASPFDTVYASVLNAAPNVCIPRF